MGEAAPSPLDLPMALPLIALESLRAAPVSIVLTALLGVLFAGVFATYLLLHLVAHTPRPETPAETHYQTVLSSGIVSPLRKLPTLAAKPSLLISIVIPAFNERARLPIMLAEAVDYLTSQGGGWEILLIDDGSTDGTATATLDWARQRMSTHADILEDQIRVVVLEANRGKGGAVTHGMRHVRGQYALFADADGATRFADLGALMKRLAAVEVDGYGVAVGSRAHMVTSDAVVKRSWVRNLLMHSFHALIRTFGVRGVGDTQCGFKLLSRSAVRAVFPYMHTEGWIFDIEILLLAGYKGVPVVEVPVDWHEVDGSKVSLVKDSVRMAWDLAVVRAGYVAGIYKVGEGGAGR